MRFSRNVFRLSYACHTFLSECLACGSIQMSCVRSAPVMRSCRNVLRSITPAVCRLCAKQDGLRYVPFLFRRGSGSPFARSRMSRGYRTWLVHFGLARFFMAIPTENERERGERGRRRGGRALLRKHIGFAAFSAGSTLGLRAPNLRQRAIGSLDSLHLIRGVGAFHAAKGTRV